MNTISAVVAVTATVFGVLLVIGGGLVYLRTGFVRERDRVRVSTIDALRQHAETQSVICDDEKAERDRRIEHLLRHHRRRHPRCRTEPDNDADD